MISPTAYATPPKTQKADGATRRVGVEIEYAGTSLEDTVGLVVDCFGGSVERDNPFRYKVTGTRLGDFKVEMDASLLGEERYLEILASLGVPVQGSWMQGLLRRVGIEVDPEKTRAAIDEMLGDAAGMIVPCEIASPPIPIPELSEIDPLISALQRSGAEGTAASLLHAFGLHLNPEIPRLDVENILTHLRAAMLLYEWIVWIAEIDPKRRLSPFIDRFPQDYVRLVMDADYSPDLDRLIDDYLAANPTRNRWLDLLPLLAEHDRERVDEHAAEPELVRARPTFHYRLPDSMVDDPEWSVAGEWNRWVLIERLAASPEWLAPMCEDYLRTLDGGSSLRRSRWLLRSARWIEAWRISP